MRILHTSDWHIGKRIAGRDRLTEQREVLHEIASICDRENVELVLVAGDVFDTYLPSAEAEDAFYGAVKEIAGKDRCVLLISGNHDDNVRLAAASSLSEDQGIYIYGNVSHCHKSCEGRAIQAIETKENSIIFRNRAGEEIFINVLPYPNEARLKENKDPNETYADKMRRWIAAGQEQNVRNLPSVFLSHLFVAGGKVSEGEREIDLGGARAVALELLPPSAYVALGHLHRRQHFKNNVFYSGSILQYAFDEAGTEKSVVVFDVGVKGAENIREIPLKGGKRLVRLAESSVEGAIALLKKYPGCHIELTLYLREPLIATQVREMQKANEGLVSILPVVQGDSVRQDTMLSRRKMSSAELFKEYYRSKFTESPPQELCELFLSLTEESDETKTS